MHYSTVSPTCIQKYYVCSVVGGCQLPVSTRKYSKEVAEQRAAQKTYEGYGLKYVAVRCNHFVTAPIVTSAEVFKPRTSR